MSSSKISQHDPRSRLHFIKYVTKGGETTRYWECGICGKEFKHQYTLVRHLPVHTDQRNFKCDLCDMAFRQLSTLIQHKASKHSGNRQYVCEVCHKSFSRVSILICHKRTHNKDKSFKCDICDKGFHQKGNLVIHMNIHSDKNPYPCPQCAKGFNQKSNLTVHLKSCSKNILGSNMNSSVGEDSSVVINTTLVPNQTSEINCNFSRISASVNTVLQKTVRRRNHEQPREVVSTDTSEDLFDVEEHVLQLNEDGSVITFY